MTRDTPDLRLLDGVVAQNVIDAMNAASLALDRAGVRHLLVGGLALGAHGAPRATKDVDFLVGDEAFEHHTGGIVTMRPGVPIQANGVVVDFLSAGESEPYLAAALPVSGPPGVAVAPLPILAYLKLKSPRAKDRSDLIELLKAGADARVVEEWLAENAPARVDAWRDVVRAAREEEEM